MSICMQLRRVSEAEAARYRREPEAVVAATMGSTTGAGQLSFELGSLFDREGSFGRSRGFFGSVRAWFIRRALKNALSKQLGQLNKVKAALAALPGQTGHSDIPSPEAMVELHKSWQVIHYVLTGTPESGPAPLNMLLVGGEEVGEDLGYGPARLVDPRVLRDFAKALKAFDLGAVLARLDVQQMAAAGVYCVDDSDDPQSQLAELEEELRHYLPALQDFANRAAADRHGALIWMS